MKSEKKILPKTFTWHHLIQNTLSVGEKKRYFYGIGHKVVKLKDSFGELDFFTYSSGLNDLFIQELKSQYSFEVKNEHIISHLTYYHLISLQNKLRLDPVVVKFGAFTFTEISIDLFSSLDRNELSSVLENSTLNRIFSYLDSEGISFITAEIENYVVDLEKDYELVVANLEELQESFPKDQLLDIYDRLRVYEKAAFHLLYEYSGSIIIPVLFILKFISTEEYISLYRIINEKFISKNCPEENLFTDFDLLESKLNKVRKYLSVCKHDELFSIIDKGETKYVEFKSTMRYDLRANQILKDREKDVLKTIAGFVNTDGGTLFIGIDDDKQVVGIEKDGFKNEDQFLLHLHNIIHDRLTPKPNRVVSSEIYEISGKKICKVICEISAQPIFLKWDNQEEFYVRTGPSTRKLGSIDMMNYVNQKYTIAGN